MSIEASNFLENFNPKYVGGWIKMGVDEQVNVDFPIDLLCTVKDMEGKKFHYEHTISDLPLLQPYGGAYTTLNPKKGFKIHWQTAPYGGKIVTDEDAINDDISGKIPEFYKGLARSATLMMQIAPQQKLVDGFTEGHPGATDDGGSAGQGDGENIFSNSHPVYPGSSTTYDNYYTGQWSLSRLETYRIAMLDFPNLLGINNYYNRPNTIVCGPDLQTSIMQDLESVYKSFSANGAGTYTDESNIINIHYGTWRLIVCPHIRGQKWFICDYESFKRSFKFMTNGEMEGRTDYVFENRKFQHAMYTRYVVSTGNPFNILGSDGTVA